MAQMSGTFQLLNSNDLVWSRVLGQYLLGKREDLNDLMAWNADGTRMPYKMHSEYLRRLFLNNDLAEGRYCVGGRPIALTDIHAPIFAVGTISDHVAPWRSTFKIQLLSDTDVTYVLTTGGHNAGIVSEPGHPNRSYQMTTKRAMDKYSDPDSWAASAPRTEGSWWPAWQQWLASHGDEKAAPPRMGAAEHGYPALCAAPGQYVLQD
jgi:polyhydroxyalkanoate synthase